MKWTGLWVSVTDAGGECAVYLVGGDGVGRCRDRVLNCFWGECLDFHGLRVMEQNVDVNCREMARMRVFEVRECLREVYPFGKAQGFQVQYISTAAFSLC